MCLCWCGPLWSILLTTANSLLLPILNNILIIGSAAMKVFTSLLYIGEYIPLIFYSMAHSGATYKPNVSTNITTGGLYNTVIQLIFIGHADT